MTDAVERALAALRKERHALRLEGPLETLAEADDPRIREALLARYAQAETQGDTGAILRTALIRALRHHAATADAPFLERAARTYEGVLQNEVAMSLRAAALVTLNEVDPTLAAYHAVRLLFEPAALSGEPALTAAKLLASQDQPLPLYRFALAPPPGAAPEVAAECLRGLKAAPPSILRELAETSRDCQDETILLGLFDAILDRPELGDVVLDFLRDTRLDGMFQWLVASLVAARREDMLPEMRRMAETDPDRTKRNMLRDALELA